MRKPSRGSLIVIAVLATPLPAAAHHSFSMFDTSKEVTLDGTVRDFQWTNPHSFVQFTVPENGQDVEYSIEGQSPNGLARHGWTHHSIKAGDRMTIVINPLKDGTRGGSFKRGVFPDGRVLNN